MLDTAEYHKPEMLISINCFVTPVAEELTAVLTYHLVTTFSSRDCHLTRWTLLGIPKNFLDTHDLIYHITHPFLLPTI